MSTLVFTANEMLQRRKRDPFNFISLAPPLLSTPGAKKKLFEVLRAPSILHHVSRQPLNKGDLENAYRPHHPRCGPSLNISRFATTSFAKFHLASGNFLLTSDPPLMQRYIWMLGGYGIIIAPRCRQITRIRNIMQSPRKIQI